MKAIKCIPSPRLVLSTPHPPDDPLSPLLTIAPQSMPTNLATPPSRSAQPTHVQPHNPHPIHPKLTAGTATATAIPAPHPTVRQMAYSVPKWAIARANVSMARESATVTGTSQRRFEKSGTPGEGKTYRWARCRGCRRHRAGSWQPEASRCRTTSRRERLARVRTHDGARLWWWRASRWVDGRVGERERGCRCGGTDWAGIGSGGLWRGRGGRPVGWC